MTLRIRVGAAATVCGVLVLCFALFGLEAKSRDPDGKKSPAMDVFGDSKVWALHLEISPQEYGAMQPPPGGFGPPQVPKDKRQSERNLFGTVFPWAQCNLSAEGKMYKKVGVRYAGDITYFASSQALKRPLKIEINKFGEQQFRGLKSFHLHAMPLDPAKGREVVAFSLFRAAGVPAPRTAFAEVTLTVSGKYDQELLGLYALIESVDGTFLKDRFGAEGGLLLKPFQVQSIE